jgi:hypothetical protein
MSTAVAWRQNRVIFDSDSCHICDKDGIIIIEAEKEGNCSS